MALFNNWFGSKECPIGVDLGSETLKLAQVSPARKAGGPRELVAAAWKALPDNCRRDPSARIEFFQENVRSMLAEGAFRGRQVVLSLPASCMYIERLRLPPMDDEQLKGSLQWQARGKLPVDPAACVLRHVVAGQVFNNQEPLSEVIVMAATKDLMNRFLAAAAKAKLDVVGMTAEPQATVDCFTHVWAGTPQAALTRMLVDIGSAATRVYIARGPQLLFARIVPIGAEHLDLAVSTELKIPRDEARRRRRDGRTAGHATARAAASTTGRGPVDTLHATSGGGGAATALVEAPPRVALPRGADIDAICARTFHRLADELELCLRYHESTFPAIAVEQILFTGGEAGNVSLCQQIAARMGISGQTGDPLARMQPSGAIDPSTLYQPPAWAVALGLSLGTVG